MNGFIAGRIDPSLLAKHKARAEKAISAAIYSAVCEFMRDTGRLPFSVSVEQKAVEGLNSTAYEFEYRVSLNLALGS